MAQVKLASLAIRSIAKPFSTVIKERAKTHEKFRGATIGLAQWLHRLEMRWRAYALGQEVRHVRPLNDAKAIDMGANFVSESFLFAVAAALIVGETWRSRAKASGHREELDDRIESLETDIRDLRQQVEEHMKKTEAFHNLSHEHTERLRDLIDKVVDIGQRSGWLKREASALPPLLSQASSTPSEQSLTTTATK